MNTPALVSMEDLASCSVAFILFLFCSSWVFFFLFLTDCFSSFLFPIILFLTSSCRLCSCCSVLFFSSSYSLLQNTLLFFSHAVLPLLPLSRSSYSSYCPLLDKSFLIRNRERDYFLFFFFFCSFYILFYILLYSLFFLFFLSISNLRWGLDKRHVFSSHLRWEWTPKASAGCTAWWRFTQFFKHYTPFVTNFFTAQEFFQFFFNSFNLIFYSGVVRCCWQMLTGCHVCLVRQSLCSCSFVFKLLGSEVLNPIGRGEHASNVLPEFFVSVPFCTLTSPFFAFWWAPFVSLRQMCPILGSKCDRTALQKGAWQCQWFVSSNSFWEFNLF